MKLNELTEQQRESIYTCNIPSDILSLQKEVLLLLQNASPLGLDQFVIKYKLLNCANYPTTSGFREIYLEQREGVDEVKWVIYMDGYCLGNDLEFYYESRPSSRTEKFIDLTRFNSKAKAILTLRNHIESLDGQQGVLLSRGI